MTNLRAVEKLVGMLPALPSDDGTKKRLWRNVQAEKVAGFVEGLQYPPASIRASGEQLAAFIRKCAKEVPSELTDWTVVFVSKTDYSDGHAVVAGHDIGFSKRKMDSSPDGNILLLNKSNILDPDDEGSDFNAVVFDQAWFNAIEEKHELLGDLDWLPNQIGRPAMDVALELTGRWYEANPPKVRRPPKDRPSGRVLRVLRKPTNGLLLIYPVAPPKNSKITEPVIGVALSFPTSNTRRGVKYRVNPVYWGTEIAEDDSYAG